MAKERTIHALITDHKIDLTGGGMYDVRKDIMAHGGMWLPDVNTWRVTPVTDATAGWAKALADTTEDKRTFNTKAPASMTLADVQINIDTVLDAPTVGDEHTPIAPRRRIKPAADGVAISPYPAGDAGDPAEAFKRFLASVGGLPAATPPAPALDVDAVGAMIQQALAPVLAQLAQRPTTHVTVTTPTDTRTIDGLSHYMLSDLIKCVATGMNVWLSGPSQAGKTTAAKQAAKALGLDYYAHGSINMAHELLGFVDAGGNYRETQFVKAYRNGGLVLLDEVDRGSNEGCLSMQMALANGEMPLPDGTMLKRHPDFRCIAAANTWGGGATSDYVGAARLDAAFLQRFPVKLHWQYDAQLELAMTDNKQWAERVQAARAKAQSNGLKVLITPQATIAGARLIAAGYTPDQAAAMTYQAGLSPDQCRMIG